MSGYSSQTRAEVLPYVPSSARTVLDVGCAAGGFGAALMELRGDGVVVDGIELDEEAAARAAERYRRVTVGGYPDVAGDESYDAIVCNDVLEHLDDPWTAVERIRAQLAPGGVVVASIPNVRHWSVVRGLVLHGRWDYAEHGILDRTHLRWFTRATMAELFTGAGFRVLTLEPLSWGEPTRLWWRAARRVAPNQTRDLLTKQYVVVATPA